MPSSPAVISYIALVYIVHLEALKKDMASPAQAGSCQDASSLHDREVLRWALPSR